MKKLLSILLTVMLLLSVCPAGLFCITASAATATSGTTGKCTWTLDGTVLAISGNGSMDNYNFYKCAPWGESITEVIINEGVTSIGASAFYGCTDLTSITIPNSVTSIGRVAFSGCSNLKYNIYDNGKYLGNESNKYLALIDTTDTDITDFKFADGVKVICGAFDGCSGLEKVYITDLETWCRIDFEDAYANPLYYAKELYINGVLATDIKIPDTVKEIKNYTFYNCSSLTSITIPNGVTSIGDSAFRDCSGLTSITIPDSVTSLGVFAFYDCSDLTSITIPNSVTSIADYAFSGCSGLTSITIPNGVTSIGNSAFSGCSGLTSITIPNSVTSIGNSAFGGCSGLTSISIPDSVTSIGNSAFYGCRGLNKVNITDLEAWCGIDFGGVYDNPLYYAKKLYINDVLATDITIPDTVKKIKDYTFYNCTSLTSVTIPNSVTSISNSAFEVCYNLEKLTIKTEKIPTGTFEDCRSLKKIFFSKNLKTVYNTAFKNSNGITDVYYEGTEEEWQKVLIQHSNGALNSENLNIYFNCTKIPDGIESVTLKTAPTKTEYIQGLEALDLTGGYLTVKYDDGATQNIALSTLTASGFKNSLLGEQTVTVRYGNYKVSFKVTVVKRKISNVSFAMPSIKEYILGDTPSTAGGGITVSYADGGRETKALTLDMISGYDMNKTGIQFVGIGYEGYEAYFKISVFRQGDTNGDGVIGALDISFLRKMLLGATAGNNLCDVNRDGETDIRDLVRIKKLATE